LSIRRSSNLVVVARMLLVGPDICLITFSTNVDGVGLNSFTDNPGPHESVTPSGLELMIAKNIGVHTFEEARWAAQCLCAIRKFPNGFLSLSFSRLLMLCL
jgi:hypothetical protein